MKKFFLFLLVFVAFSGLKAQENQGVIKVQGQSITYAIPEVVIVTIPIQVKDVAYEATNNKLRSTYNALIESLVKKGLKKEEIKTNMLSISEDYNYSDRERRLVGYIGNINVMIEVKHTNENINKIMNVLSEERFNFGYNMRFALSETQKAKLLEEAMIAAVKDARTKATTLAEAVDLTLGTISEIRYETEEVSMGPLVYRDQMFSESNMKAENIELNPEEIEVRKQVNIIWNLQRE